MQPATRGARDVAGGLATTFRRREATDPAQMDATSAGGNRGGYSATARELESVKRLAGWRESGELERGTRLPAMRAGISGGRGRPTAVEELAGGWSEAWSHDRFARGLSVGKEILGSVPVASSDVGREVRPGRGRWWSRMVKKTSVAARKKPVRAAVMSG